MRLSRVVALSAAVSVLFVACSTTVPGQANRDPGVTVSTSSTRTLTTPSTVTTTTRTSSSTSTTTSTSTSTTTTSTPEEEDWAADVSTYDLPAGLGAVSPDGEYYATHGSDGVCIGRWESEDRLCPVTAAAEFATLQFSVEGSLLSAVLTTGGLSSIWIIGVGDGSVAVVGADAVLTPDPTAPGQFAVAGSTWSSDETAFLAQLLPAEGAPTGDLWVVPTTPGVAAIAFPVPADIAGSYPQMAAATNGVVYAPNTGPATGQLWWLDDSFAITQIGSENFSEGGTVLLQGVSPDGATALICPASGAVLGELETVDVVTGEHSPYLQGEGCQSGVFDPEGSYVSVAGAVNDVNLLTVFSLSDDEVPLNVELGGVDQLVPALQTWRGDILTVRPLDTTDPAAKVDIVRLDRG